MRITKNPALRKKDKRIENIVIKYDEYLKKVDVARREKDRIHSAPLVESNSNGLGADDNPQIGFMREVLYNYLDKELKQDRIDY